MNTYRHLTPLERESIMLMLNQGVSISHMARVLNRNKSTISRELRRNAAARPYSACEAEEHYRQRRTRCCPKPKFACALRLACVQEKLLDRQWSPEQIEARMKQENSALSVSYATIYRAIRQGRLDRDGQQARWHLRHKGKRRRKSAEVEKRGKIAISHPLAKRPVSAHNRSRFGHWEADTVAGKQGGAVLLTLVERKSRYLLTAWLPKKNAQALKAGMLDVLRDMPLRSITPDRGKEFASHAQLSDELQVPFYFPEPGQPWQRGSNENTNGLLRQYFPKRQDLGQYSAAQIQAVTDKINLRPRKCLGWKCAYEVLFRKTLRLV